MHNIFISHTFPLFVLLGLKLYFYFIAAIFAKSIFFLNSVKNVIFSLKKVSFQWRSVQNKAQSKQIIKKQFS